MNGYSSIQSLQYLQLVLGEHSKLRIESNSYFGIRFDSKRAQLFEIFEYLASPISYLFNRMTPIFHLSKQQNQQTWSRLRRQCRLKTLNIV